MSWLDRFRSPRCPTCGRKVTDCPKVSYTARRVDAGAYVLPVERTITPCDEIVCVDEFKDGEIG